MNDTAEVDSDIETDNDSRHELLGIIDKSIQNGELGENLIAEIENIEVNIKRTTGQARFHLESVFIQELFTRKNEYCSKQNIDELPEVSEVIREINHYLLSMIEELEIKEALLKQGL